MLCSEGYLDLYVSKAMQLSLCYMDLHFTISSWPSFIHKNIQWGRGQIRYLLINTLNGWCCRNQTTFTLKSPPLTRVFKLIIDGLWVISDKYGGICSRTPWSWYHRSTIRKHVLNSAHFNFSFWNSMALQFYSFRWAKRSSSRSRKKRSLCF